MATEYNLQEETDFFPEDPKHDVIKNLRDPEEIDATIELLEEKIDASEKGSASDDSESDKPKEKESGSSEESEETTSKDQETEKSSDKEEEKEGEKETPSPEEGDENQFVTDEFINNQPEEDRKLFESLKGKSKADLAKTAANAIAMKSPYLKGNEEAINAVAKKLEGYSDEELTKAFVDTQRETGRSDKPSETIPEKVELPKLPEDDPKVRGILDKEVIKRLKKNPKYSEMPGDMTGDEYKEWRRDLNDEDPDNTFIKDLSEVKSKVNNELQKVVYAETNLQNLYNNSPDEILPLLSDDSSIPKLKHLNDNYKDILHKSVNNEIGLIKDALKQYDITLEDLGVDLSLTTDADGLPFNESLNKLIYNGNQLDHKIIRTVGKVPILNKGELAEKFISKNNAAILNQLVAKKATKDKTTVEKLKEENLNTLGGSHTRGEREVLQPQDIKGTTDPNKLDKILADLEKD